MLFAFNTSLGRVAILAVCVALSLLAWRRFAHRTSAPLSQQDVVAEMQSRARQAVDTAATDFTINLDYSPDSIRTIEDILSRLHIRHKEAPFPDEHLTKQALQWGGYVGEVIKKTRTAEWALDSTVGGPGSLPVVYSDKGESFPVRWCYKRIVNGSEDNVWHKFSALVLDRDNLPTTSTSKDSYSIDVQEVQNGM